ncbi:hypothetical protein [Glutamicibacter sp.]|uniref:hypothetical protein n=1 Tax=Glutamicibacter sp. TaxID=1931995 RepID=UPI0028BEC604|nr:hypothetical protein [Glutamicibacter sp.]
MKPANRASVGLLAIVFFASMYLAWNQRIPDPWGVILVGISFLALGASIAAEATRRTKQQR